MITERCNGIMKSKPW